MIPYSEVLIFFNCKKSLTHKSRGCAIKTLSNIRDAAFCQVSQRHKIHSPKAPSLIFDRFNTPNRYRALYLTLEHLKNCLNTSNGDTKLCYPLKVSLLLFIKILSNELFGNSSFPINTTLEAIKHEL